MDRVAVVTGGAAGIGLAITHRLAREGYRVAILDVDGPGAERAAKELDDTGTRALGVQVDVSDRAQVDAAIASVHDVLGPVDVLVANAAVAVQQPFLEMTLESWNRVLSINLTGPFHCVQAVLPDMLEARQGRVVLISSSSAQRGAPRMAHYAASKGGIIALTKALAMELGGTGVTVNNVAPSSIDSPSVRKKQEAGIIPPSDVLARHIPVGRVGRGEDIAAACAYLASEDASFVTGHTLSVNGGSFMG